MKSLLLTILLVLCLSEITAQEVRVESGFFTLKYFHKSEQISKEKFENILATNTEAINRWNKGKKQENLWWTFAAIQLGFAVWEFTDGKTFQEQPIPFVGIVSSFTVGSIFFFKSINSKRNAISMYNEKFKDKTVFNLTLLSDQNGIGLALNF